MKKKNVVLIVSIVSVVLLVAAGTFAYWYYRGANKNVSLVTGAGIDDSSIVYNVGESHFVGNFQPVSSFCQSTSTTLSFYKTSAASNSNLSATIYMKVNDIGDNISASNDVYWLITSGDSSISCEDGLSSSSIINYGTFNSVRDGDIITLNSVGVTTSEQKFTIWIWIDSTGDSLPTLSGDTIDTNIWTEISMVPPVDVESPVLDSGMIPVTIANNGTVTTVSETDSSWYNYSTKQWANAVLVDDDSRSYYQSNISKNVVVNESDIKGYYVWVPRYKYKINSESYTVPATKCGELDNEKVTAYSQCYEKILTTESKQLLAEEIYNDMLQYNSSYTMENANTDLETLLNGGTISFGGVSETLQGVINGYDGDLQYEYSYNNDVVAFDSYTAYSAIDIEFESKDAPREIGDAVNSYYTHPAFWWDDDNDNVTDSDEMLAGIWVGKFENIYGKPNVYSSTCSVKSCFNDSKNIAASNGLNNNKINSHMIKNSEWGAVAYLSNSQYGINDKVWENTAVMNPFDDTNNWNHYKSSLTGCKNGSFTMSGDYNGFSEIGIVCNEPYGQLLYYPQSTTGNISGVFDMVGGNEEYVMGNYNNTIYSSDYDSENGLCDPSGMCLYDSDLDLFTALPERKYYDVYTTNTISTACNNGVCYGHALSETNGWYNTTISFVTDVYPWLYRKNLYGTNAWYGTKWTEFAAYNHTITSRSVLINGFAN